MYTTDESFEEIFAWLDADGSNDLDWEVMIKRTCRSQRREASKKCKCKWTELGVYLDVHFWDAGV